VPTQNGDATLSELRLQEMNACFPALTKRNLGLELANAFSVIRRTFSLYTATESTWCHGPIRRSRWQLKQYSRSV
jgi:hypothetical protein